MSSVQESPNIKRVIIDTDCGMDDAVALLLALLMKQKHQDVKIEAITTVCGNVELSKVRPNVLRVLQYCNAADIVVYEGADSPIVEPHRDASFFHGSDGFGGVAKKYPAADVPVPDEHAANALVRLARSHKGEISLVAIGPLTNVAIAQQLDNTFFDNLKEIIVMGGSTTGSGNDSLGAEFNFGCDPEAMAIVLSEIEKPKLVIVPFDVCDEYPVDWKWLDSLNDRNKFVRFFKDVMNTGFETWKKEGRSGAPVYDMVAMAIYFDHLIAETSIVCPVYPELRGQWTRGGTVIDRRSPRQWEKQANAKIVTQIDINRFKRMFINSL